MTTVITRLYKDADAANAVAQALHETGFPKDTLDVIPSGTKDAAAVLMSSKVNEDAAQTYAGEIAKSGAVLVVRAPFTPFGAARAAMEIVDEHDPMESAVTNNNVLLKESMDPSYTTSSVLKSHPLFVTDPGEFRRNDGRISTGFGWKLLSKHKTKRSAMSGTRHMSRMFWPMPLLSKKKDKVSVYRGGKKFLTS